MTWLRILGLSILVAAGCVTDSSDEDGIDDSFTDGGKADAYGVVDNSPDALGVLAVANELDRAHLVSDVKLASHAATSIAAYKAGPDGVTGTGDDRTFHTLEELDAVPYVGKIAFGHLLTYAREHGYVHADNTCATGSWNDTQLQLDVAQLLDIVVDASGGQHLVYFDVGAYVLDPANPDTLIGPGVRYQYRAPNGAWRAPESIEGIPEPVGSSFVSIALDSSGTPHVVYSSAESSPTMLVRYSHRNADGSWTTPATVGVPSDFDDVPVLLIDAQDTLHVVRSTEHGLRYATKLATASSWTETAINTDTRAEWISFARDAHGEYVAYMHDHDLKYASRADVAAPFTTETVFTRDIAFDGEELGLAVEPNGTAHVTFRGDTQLYEATRPSGGTWSNRVLFGAIDGGYSDLAIDGTGRMYLSYDRSDYFGGVTRLESSTRAPGGDWATPQVVDANPDDKIGLRNHIAIGGGRISIAHLGSVNSTIGGAIVDESCP